MSHIVEMAEANGIPLKKVGIGYVTTCPRHSDKEPSLRIDPDKDVFYCSPCNDGSGYVGFAEWFGVKLPAKERTAPSPAGWIPEVKGWLEARKISQAEIAKLKSIRWSGKPTVIFESKDHTGVLLYAKYRDIADKQRMWLYPKGVQLVLYGLDELKPGKTAIIVEGELDVHALRTVGIANVVSVPNGCGTKLTKEMLQPVDGYETVLVASDKDAAGEKLAGQLADQIGRARCRRLIFGDHKDANDALMAGWTEKEFATSIDAAMPFPASATPSLKHLFTKKKGDSEIRAATPAKAERALAFFSNNLPPTTFRFNEFVKEILFTEWQIGTRQLDDAGLQRLVAFAAWYGHDFNVDLVARTVDLLARGFGFHPVRDYLRALQWDQTPRISRWLTAYCGACDDAYTALAGRLWMISAVARIVDPGCKADHVLILEGPQGIGKSTALRTLVGADWFDDTSFDLQSKDRFLALHGVWVHEFSELETLSKAEHGAIKAFVSSQVDRYRAPYARLAAEHARQCVFAGTTNESIYFTDQTGNRRYWPVKVDKIDIAGLAASRDQLWAEAVALHKAGAHWWPTPEQEQTLLAPKQEERAAPGIEDELEWWISQDAARKEFTLHDALDGLGADPGTATDAKRKEVARALKRLGWMRTELRKHGTSGPRLYRRNP